MALAEISEEEFRRRAQLIQASYEFRLNVGRALMNRYEDAEPAEHVEQTIYEGFPSWRDEGVFDQFHAATAWDERFGLLHQLKDRRYQQLGRRLVHVEHPAALPDRDRRGMNRWLADRLLTEDEGVPWTTIPHALRQLDEMLDEDPTLGPFASELRRFLEQRTAELRALET